MKIVHSFNLFRYGDGNGTERYSRNGNGIGVPVNEIYDWAIYIQFPHTRNNYHSQKFIINYDTMSSLIIYENT